MILNESVFWVVCLYGNHLGGDRHKACCFFVTSYGASWEGKLWNLGLPSLTAGFRARLADDARPYRTEKASSKRRVIGSSRKVSTVFWRVTISAVAFIPGDSGTDVPRTGTAERSKRTRVV